MESGEYDHQAVEAAARALWEAHDVYRYDRDGPARYSAWTRRRRMYRRRTCTWATR